MCKEKDISEMVLKEVNTHNIKHISFDFWNTIYFSNPEFKKERNLLLSNKSDFEIEEIQKAVTEISKFHNDKALSKNRLINSEQLNYMLFDKIGIKNNKTNVLLCIYDLFQKNHPIFRYKLPDLINILKDQRVTLSIMSNTAYIPGSEIRKILKKNNLLKYFSFCQFSDEFGFGKPANLIFDDMKIKVKSIHGNLNWSQILHVGDDIKCDILGGIENGIKTLKV